MKAYCVRCQIEVNSYPVSAREYEQAILGSWTPRKVRAHCQALGVDPVAWLDEELARLSERNLKLVFAAMEHHEGLVSRCTE